MLCFSCGLGNQGLSLGAPSDHSNRFDTDICTATMKQKGTAPGFSLSIMRKWQTSFLNGSLLKTQVPFQLCSKMTLSPPLSTVSTFWGSRAHRNAHRNEEQISPRIIRHRVVSAKMRMATSMLHACVSIFTTCVRLAHHPSCWKEVKVVVIPKLDKPDYSHARQMNRSHCSKQ